MKILSLHLGHNATAAIAVDGKIVGVFSQEKTDNIKNSAALHQADHTLRPKVLEYNANPSYYRLIENFEKRTGIGAILNTSYNLHGFPLVSSLDQAIMTIENSELKFIAIGDFLLQKK